MSFGCIKYPERHLDDSILPASLLTLAGEAWMILLLASQTLGSRTLPYWKEETVAGQVLQDNSVDLQMLLQKLVSLNTNTTKPTWNHCHCFLSYALSSQHLQHQVGKISIPSPASYSFTFSFLSPTAHPHSHLLSNMHEKISAQLQHSLRQ